MISEREIQDIITALRHVHLAHPGDGFHNVEMFRSNDKMGSESRSIRITVWHNRTVVEWGFAHERYVTRTTYTFGHWQQPPKWSSSIRWLTEEQCKRLVELDGNLPLLREEFNV